MATSAPQPHYRGWVIARETFSKSKTTTTMERDIVNWQLLIPLVVTTIVAISGWIVGHRLNSERDLQNKRIELRIKYLLEA